ncbi:sucrose-6F-phosphate phosphohydrolase domain protein [Peptoanaerobacter stomatis]|uniref:Sucrose-6F-phosphate phosphohydrolase domain protein n=1 Tax=Peptoanaerobacter stomatis TaxID=796937 RepID=J5WSW6_9FIRM|nr:HAD hydrolase family protein [Peptoanaerobacter stomatis]EJU24127.1 sucrose-6F-phosphate phosphohydrolase domain protein [Peptoanaerobacter stomatis]
MKVFNTDLDNTLIYSYKKDIGENKKNVEIYNGRQISFITDKTYHLLKKLNEKLLIVPTTTRTEEQYKRIDLDIGQLKYALVCNGSILLIDGQEDEMWYNTSLSLIENSKNELEKSLTYLQNDNRRNFELQFIKNLFVFTKCENSQNVVNDLKNILDTSKVDVFNNKEKLYVIPKNLSKGNALLRFKQYLDSISDNKKIFISAGDSEFDISMFDKTDISIAPQELSKIHKIPKNTILIDNFSLFSETMLEKIESMLDNQFHTKQAYDKNAKLNVFLF